MEKKRINKKIIICIGIIISVIVAMIIISFSINTSKLNTSQNNLNIKENPYKVSNEYDGAYSFKMESSNNSGYAYFSTGLITLDNGKCKVKYELQSEISSYSNTYLFEGFCGLDSNNEYYINLNDGQYIYVCDKKENCLNCELKSTYDLSGNANHTLVLESLNNIEDLNTFYIEFVNQEKTKWNTEKEQKKAEEKARKEAEEKAQKEAEEKNFKESCKVYTFEQMARNPDKFKGTNVKITGEVVQALYGTNSVDLRVNITKNGHYSTYYTDTIYVIYNTKTGEDKILEDDIITIYGTSMGDYSYTSTIGAKVTLPLISAKYIILEK